jgi:hypothetical protein
MWQWPATFIEIYLPRLIQMGRIDQNFADGVRADLARAEKNRNSFMLTPLGLEIIAEKITEGFSGPAASNTTYRQQNRKWRG